MLILVSCILSRGYDILYSKIKRFKPGKAPTQIVNDFSNSIGFAYNVPITKQCFEGIKNTRPGHSLFSLRCKIDHSIHTHTRILFNPSHLSHRDSLFRNRQKSQSATYYDRHALHISFYHNHAPCHVKNTNKLCYFLFFSLNYEII